MYWLILKVVKAESSTTNNLLVSKVHIIRTATNWKMTDFNCKSCFQAQSIKLIVKNLINLCVFIIWYRVNKHDNSKIVLTIKLSSYMYMYTQTTKSDTQTHRSNQPLHLLVWC